MGYTKLERACGKEDVLVITDVFTKMTVAVATKVQTHRLQQRHWSRSGSANSVPQLDYIPIKEPVSRGES